MQILSALDAISPALSRTKLVLFSPFRMGRSWKLAATGYLAFTATFFLPFPLIYSGFVPALVKSGALGTAAFVSFLIAAFMAIFLGIFYICSRLEFAFFDIVLNRGELVAPAWRKYGQQTWPWIGVKVIAGSLLTVALAAPLAGSIHHGIALMRSLKPGQPPPAEFMAMLFSFEFGIFALFGGLFLFGSLLTDFVLPSLALENTTLLEAFRRFWRLIMREPGQVLGFIFMKVVLGIAGYVAQTIVLYALIFVFIVILGLVLGIGYLVLHALHVPSAAMVVLAILIVVPAYLFLIFYCVFLMVGTVLTFLQAYALYFLAGRYPMIGTLLEQSAPPVFLYYPPPGPPPPQWNPAQNGPPQA